MIQTYSAAEAAEILRAAGMHISAETVRLGLEQGVFPFGLVVHSSEGKPRCYVFAGKLHSWMQEMEGEKK